MGNVLFILFYFLNITVLRCYTIVVLPPPPSSFSLFLSMPHRSDGNPMVVSSDLMQSSFLLFSFFLLLVTSFGGAWLGWGFDTKRGKYRWR